MPDTYSKQDVLSFRDKILMLKQHEEKNLNIESSNGSVSFTRLININAYEHLLELFDSHFKEDEPAPKRRGGRKKGSKNKPKEESSTPPEEPFFGVLDQ